MTYNCTLSLLMLIKKQALSVLQAADEFEVILGKLHARNLPEFFELIEERIERERGANGGGAKQRGAEANVEGMKQVELISINLIDELNECNLFFNTHHVNK